MTGRKLPKRSQRRSVMQKRSLLRKKSDRRYSGGNLDDRDFSCKTPYWNERCLWNRGDHEDFLELLDATWEYVLGATGLCVLVWMRKGFLRDPKTFRLRRRFLEDVDFLFRELKNRFGGIRDLLGTNSDHYYSMACVAFIGHLSRSGFFPSSSRRKSPTSLWISAGYLQCLWRI